MWRWKPSLSPSRALRNTATSITSRARVRSLAALGPSVPIGGSESKVVMRIFSWVRADCEDDDNDKRDTRNKYIHEVRVYIYSFIHVVNINIGGSPDGGVPLQVIHSAVFHYRTRSLRILQSTSTKTWNIHAAVTQFIPLAAPLGQRDKIPRGKIQQSAHVHRIFSEGGNKRLGHETSSSTFFVNPNPYPCEHGLPTGNILAVSKTNHKKKPSIYTQLVCLKRALIWD